MPEHASGELVLSATTANPRFLTLKSKKPTRKDLQKTLTGKPDDLLLCQVMAETYRPAMDSCKLVTDVYGNNSKFPLYGVINKQIAAKCQMNGVNDLSASRRQRISALTMFEDVYEVHIESLEKRMTKEEMQSLRNDRLTRTALFHGLGSKKDLAALNKRKDK